LKFHSLSWNTKICK